MREQAQVEMAFAKQQQAMASPSAASGGAGGDPCSLSSSSCDGTRLRRSELTLRCVAVIASVSALVFLVTDKQTRSFTIYTSTVIQEAVFSDMKALVSACITLGIVAFYSVLQIVRCLCGPSSTSITPSSATAWTIFLLDQVMTYLILSAAAASAQSAWFSEQGNEGFKWMKVCYLYKKFCMQVGTGIIGSFVTSVAMVFISAISAFNLFARVDYAE
ncbi:hypothetical protein GOP47_0020739 [Adiantum capillus-veneris]|uniref:CASP-like protein n=1 Tax=Adiantum capillus-veneris TaxID=13818 RepID=A0A9D4U9Q7_ADICA|nr:hypothetical protein GOP47_0020739 [Adiantum capillus-veneris]